MNSCRYSHDVTGNLSLNITCSASLCVALILWNASSLWGPDGSQQKENFFFSIEPAKGSLARLGHMSIPQPVSMSRGMWMVWVNHKVWGQEDISWAKLTRNLAKIESLSAALRGTLSTDTHKTLEGEYNFILPISRWGNWGLGRVYFFEQLGSSRALSWPQVFLGFTKNSLSCNRPDWIAFQCGRK